MINKSISNWLNNQKKKQLLTVEKINLSKLSKWIYGKKEIYHISKKFFKIAGIRIQSNFYNKKHSKTNKEKRKNLYFSRGNCKRGWSKKG